MNSAAARTLFIPLRTAVTAVVLWLVLRYYGVGRIVDIIAHLQLGWLAVGFLLAIAQILVIAWRWGLLCNVLTGASPRLRTLLLGLGRSLLLGQLLPATVGIDAVRAAALLRAIGPAGAVRSVVCDRLLALLALLLIVAAELPGLARLALPGPAVPSLAAIALAGLAGFITVLVSRPLLSRIPLVGKPARLVVDDLWLAFARSRGRLAFVAGAFSHLMSVLIFVALLHSVDGAASTRVAALVILPALLIVSVPVSLGGWGLREAAVATGFSLLGADPVPALTASILFGLSGPLTGAVIEIWGLLAHANDLVGSRAP